jgi:hypothetical protein
MDSIEIFSFFKKKKEILLFMEFKSIYLNSNLFIELKYLNLFIY